MSWRRRLLGTTALVGASVLCLRPVLTTGIERRLSEQLRLPVEIGDAMLAMSQSSLHLSRFQIDDENCPLSIEDLSLRLDGNGLLYRDCIVESFVGNGLKWYLPKPLQSPSTTAIPNLTTEDPSAITEIQEIFSQALRSIKDAESVTQDRSREINLKLEAIQNKIKEAPLRDPTPNPLRNAQSVEKLRSDLIAIQALLASDRVESAKMDAATSDSFDQLNAILESARKQLPTPTTTPDEIHVAIRERSLHWITQRVRPYAVAAETGYQRFLQQFSLDSNESLTDEPPPALMRAGRELVTDKIPVREFALKRGKLTGLSTNGDDSLPTEIVISSIRLKRRDANLLQISWQDPTSNAETNCKVGPSIGTDHSISHLLNLVHKENGSETSLQVDYKPTSRDISISFPLSSVLDEILCHDPEFITAMKEICQRTEIQVIAHCENSLETDALADSNQWIVDNESNVKIESAIKEAINQCLYARQEAWLHRASSEYTSAKQLLESRRLSMEEERSFRHTTWTDTLKTLESKINSIDSTNRNALSRDSNLVR